MLEIEKHAFFTYFFNIDILLIMKLTSMKTAIHIAEIHLEGRVPQTFDIGLSFCFIFCRRVDFQTNYKKAQKLHFFALK